MDNVQIFPIIIIILGFGYLGATIFLYKKETVSIGVPTISLFWMIKKEKSPKYFWLSIMAHVIMSFIFIGSGILWLLGMI
jgi:hypothetical protein